MTPSLRDRLQLLSRKGFPIEGKESESDSGFYIFFLKKKGVQILSNTCRGPLPWQRPKSTTDIYSRSIG